MWVEKWTEKRKRETEATAKQQMKHSANGEHSKVLRNIERKKQTKDNSKQQKT